MASNIDNNPSSQFNLVKLIYDDDIVSIINSLSKRIKDFYKDTKKSLHDINSSHSSLINRNLLLKSTVNDIILTNPNTTSLSPLQTQIDKITELQSVLNDNIEEMNKHLSSFFDDAKEHFKQLKKTRNDKLENIIAKNSSLNEDNNNNNESIFNNSSHNKYSPIKKSNSKTLASNYNTLNEQLLWNVNHLYNNNNNVDNAPRSQYNSHRRMMSASSSKKTLLPSKSQDKALLLQNKIPLKDDASRNNNNNKIQKQAQCSLAKNILQFFTELLPFFHTYPNMKSKLEPLKQDIQSQANKIIIKDYSNSFSSDNYHYNALCNYQEDNKLKSAQLDKTKSQIELLNNEKETLIQENNEIRDILSKLSQVNMSSVEQGEIINNLTNEISSLKNDIQSKQNQIHSLELKLQNPELKTLYNKLQTNFKRQENELKRLSIDNNERIKQNTKLHLEMTTLLKKSKTDKEKIKVLETQLNAKDVLIAKYMKDINQMQNQRNNSQIHKNNLLTTKSKEMEMLIEENTVNKIIIANLNNELKQYETNAKNSITSNTKINSQLTKLNKQIQLQKEEIDKLHIALAVAKHNDEKTNDKNKENSSDEIFKKLMNENISLKKEILSEHSQKEKMDEIINLQIQQINEQKIEIEEMKKMYNLLSNPITNQTNSNNRLYKPTQIDQGIQVNDNNNEKTLMLLNIQIGELHCKLKSKNEELTELQQKISELETHSQDTKNKNELNLQNEINLLKSSLKEEKERNKIKDSNNEVLANLNEEYIQKINGLEKENHSLKSKVSGLEEKQKKDNLNLIENYNNQITVLEQQKLFIEQTIRDKQKQNENEIKTLQSQLMQMQKNKSQIIITKQNSFSFLSPKISPDTHMIISHHLFKSPNGECIWYLLKPKISPSSYNNMIWMSEPLIEDTLPQYNSYSILQEEDNQKLINFYIQKLEQKEDEISKLKHKLSKTKTQISQTEVSESSELNEVQRNKTKITDNKIQFSNDNIDFAILNKSYVQDNNQKIHEALLEKYNVALAKLNESENQMAKMQSQLKQYKNELLSASRTFTIEANETDIQKYKEYIKRIKQEKKSLEEQLTFFKQQYKESELKMKNIANDIKKLLSNMKVDSANKNEILNICKLLGLNEKEFIEK